MAQLAECLTLLLGIWVTDQEIMRSYPSETLRIVDLQLNQLM